MYWIIFSYAIWALSHCCRLTFLSSPHRYTVLSIRGEWNDIHSPWTAREASDILIAGKSAESAREEIVRGGMKNEVQLRNWIFDLTLESLDW